MDLLRNCLYFHVLFSLVHTFLITSKVLIKLQLLKVGLEQFKKIENDIVSIIFKNIARIFKTKRNETKKGVREV